MGVTSKSFVSRFTVYEGRSPLVASGPLVRGEGGDVPHRSLGLRSSSLVYTSQGPRSSETRLSSSNDPFHSSIPWRTGRSLCRDASRSHLLGRLSSQHRYFPTFFLVHSETPSLVRSHLLLLSSYSSFSRSPSLPSVYNPEFYIWVR